MDWTHGKLFRDFSQANRVSHDLLRKNSKNATPNSLRILKRVALFFYFHKFAFKRCSVRKIIGNDFPFGQTLNEYERPSNIH